MKRPHTQRGFTLLLAALVASIVLMLGSSIFSIAQKQVTLSSLGRDSQYAFYAADTGAECALYYDIRQHSFPTSTPATPATIVCDKNSAGADDPVATTVTGDSNHAVATFSINVFTRDIISGKAQDGNCVAVTVTKYVTPPAGEPYTRIHADGYSTRCEQINTSARSLQRSIELKY